MNKAINQLSFRIYMRNLRKEKSFKTLIVDGNNCNLMKLFTSFAYIRIIRT